jgi:hypothetical protein
MSIICLIKDLYPEYIEHSHINNKKMCVFVCIKHLKRLFAKEEMIMAHKYMKKSSTSSGVRGIENNINTGTTQSTLERMKSTILYWKHKVLTRV